MKIDQRPNTPNRLRASGFRVQTGLRGGDMADTRETIDVLFNLPLTPSLPLNGKPAAVFPSHPYADLLQECSAWGTWKTAEDANRVAPHAAEQQKTRFWELDAARGWAIIMMVVKHLTEGWIAALNPALASNVFRLWLPLKCVTVVGICGSLCFAALQNSATVSRIAGWLAPGQETLWRNTLAAAGALAFGGGLELMGSGAVFFLFIMGVSMAVREGRAKDTAALKRGWWRRGFMLMALGIAVTVASLVVVPQAPVLFGILQLLGLSTILAMPFLSLPGWVTVAAALANIAVGTWVLPHLPVQSCAWVWLGLYPPQMHTVDYAPLFPFLGTVFLGLVIGKTIYEKGIICRFSLPDLSRNRVVRSLSGIGQHTLAIYMAQVPLYLSGMAAAL